MPPPSPAFPTRPPPPSQQQQQQQQRYTAVPPPVHNSSSSSSGMAATRLETKQKLANILDGFSHLDLEVKVGTQQRREKDEQRLHELRGAVIKIDKALSAEIKRGLERNKALEKWAEEQLAATATTFAARLEERTQEAHERLGVLRTRVDSLEEFFAREKEQALALVEEKGNALAKSLADVQEGMDAERRDRLEREGRLLRQLGEHEQEVALRFEQERTSRETKLGELKQGLEDFVRARSKIDERFQSYVSEELCALKGELAREAQARAREDDEIVEALGRYTSKLQHSLKIVNQAASGSSYGVSGSGSFA